MMHLRLLTPPALLALAVGCTGGGGDDDSTDSDGEVDPNGANHTFVISGIDVPTSPAEASALGFDLDGKPGVENQLAVLLGELNRYGDVQRANDRAIDVGAILSLANVKAEDLTDAPGVGLWVYEGETTGVTPAPCADSADTVCRHHLNGNGQFSVAESSSTDQYLAGSIAGSNFTGEAWTQGPLPLQITLFAGTPVVLSLHRAHADLRSVTEDGWATSAATPSRLGGAVSATDLLPAIAVDVRARFAEECGGTPPTCGCASGSVGEALRDGFANALDADCEISEAEVQLVLGPALAPDIDLDGDGANDALSAGVGLSAVHGIFNVP